jgi:Fe-S-cluster containining protein
MMASLQDRPYFFDRGLRFACIQCGRCCTGEPGTVYVAASEIGPIAAYLDMPPADLIADMLYPFRDSYSARERASGDCVFFHGGCRIYPVRPRQCRAYPFWFSNLRSRYNWKQAAAECPGIGQGPLYTRKEILGMVGETF